jgi:hypothetical protein
MYTRQMEYDYLKRMFSLARQDNSLIPAQRRYFMRQLSLQHLGMAQAQGRQNGTAAQEEYSGISGQTSTRA